MKDRLITLVGGGGFVGRYVAQALLDRGARVRIAQRDPRQAWFIKPMGRVGQVQFVAADITRPETLGPALAGSDAVVNLVGILNGPFDAIQAKGAGNVAQAAAQAGARDFVQISAIGADPNSPSPYGKSKAEGEKAVSLAIPQSIVLRPSVIFGPEDQFINRFAGMISSTPVPVVPILSAKTRFQPIYVSDVADAVAVALADPTRFRGQTLSLGGPDIISMGELVRWIAKEIGRSVAFAEIPDSVGAMIAGAGFLPGAPITRSQWLMLKQDNVVPEGDPGVAALGIKPVPMSSVAPNWLVKYRRQGRFGDRATS